MATIDQVEKALIRADQAGDAEAAKMLAGEVRRLRMGQVSAPVADGKIPTAPDQTKVGLVENAGRGARAMIAAPLVGGAQRLGLDDSQGASDVWRKDVSDIGSRPGGTIGMIAGGAAMAAPLAMIPGANTVGGGALVGALQGAMQPTQTGESPAGNIGIGAATGGIVPAGINAAKGIKAMVVDPFTEAGRNRMAGAVINRMAGDDAPGVAARLAAATGETPGFVPSVAQAARNDGVSAFERTMRAINPQAFNELDRAQRGALVDALRSVAKTPEERSAAVALRDAAVSPLYDAAKKATATGDPMIDALLARPSMQAATGRAVNIANERGANFSMPSARQAQSIPSGLLDATGSPITSQVPYKPAQYSGQTLHDLKLGLDDAIGTPATGMQGAERGAAIGTKNAFSDWLESKVPEYAQAKSTFADMSKPINQMDIGQSLYNRMVPALADQGSLPFRTNAQSYAAALRNGDEVAKAATGFKGATLEGAMNPDQLALLRGVAKDAESKAAAEAGGRGVGSDTVQKIAMSHIGAEAGIPNWLSSIARVPGGWAKRAGDVLYGNADEQVRQGLAHLLANPQEASMAMKAAGVTPSRLAELLKKGAQAAALASPSAVTALSTQ